MIQNIFTDQLNYHFVSSTIKKLFDKLFINNSSEKGAIIIIHPTYIFVCPLTKPYNYYENIPLFAEPEFFAGIFCLPLLETVWPQTTQSKYIENNNCIDILKTSTKD